MLRMYMHVVVVVVVVVCDANRHARVRARTCRVVLTTRMELEATSETPVATQPIVERPDPCFVFGAQLADKGSEGETKGRQGSSAPPTQILI